MKELIKAIMRRDECGLEEAIEEFDRIYEDVQAGLEEGEDPEEILHEHGWEPDYLFDVLY